ncbi:MAG: redoxin domain-containing protein [Pirellula sp.]|nr:redoxin domain-containing protein [Pirellula sp.]
MPRKKFSVLRTFERLERRDLFAADWQNAVNQYDVDMSGVVDPYDVLMVINEINSNGMRVLSSRPVEGTPPPMFDVNGDGDIGPMDVLLVINALNRVEVGTIAPNVTLPNQRGEIVDLSQFLGKRAVVLYFYPKNDTPGCTVEALDFSARKNQISELGAEVFGVSLDSVGSHQNFADKHVLNFDILSDASKDVTTAFGALTERDGTPYAKRRTFIIGADGVVKKIFTDVDVQIHGEEVVAALQAGVAH